MIFENNFNGCVRVRGAINLHICLTLIIAMNIRSTLILVRSPYYSHSQKIIQFALIWALPVVGALFVSSLASDVLATKISTDLQDRLGNDDGDIRLKSEPYDSGGDGGGSD